MKRPKKGSAILTVGLTGVLGCGKTTVLSYFKKAGCRILSADVLVHQELEHNKVLQQKLKRAFGADIFSRGNIAPERLACRGFASRKNLNRLNRIIHPVVKKKIVDFLRHGRRRSGISVAEIPLLFEAKMSSLFDCTVGVTVRPEVLGQRLQKHSRLSRRDIQKRMRWQMSAGEKLSRCDFIIDNSRTLTNTRRQVKELMKILKTQGGVKRGKS
ncbi:MAG: dephospho-CoA kinase [Candidatus Omnitrophota bacterium]